MSKNTLTLKEIIYKEKLPFILKREKELQNDIFHLKLNSDQLSSLITELHFKIANRKGLSIINTLLTFILTIISLGISSFAFLFSTSFQNLFELTPPQEKMNFLHQMMNTIIYKDIENITSFYARPYSFICILFPFIVVYISYTLRTYHLKHILSFLYTYQRTLHSS